VFSITKQILTISCLSETFQQTCHNRVSYKGLLEPSTCTNCFIQTKLQK